MKRLAVLSATVALAACGIGGDPPCDVDADVVGVSVADSMISTDSPNAALRVGETVRVCMLGSNDCTSANQRFDFQSDAPAVVTAANDPQESLVACNELLASHTYPCCAVSVGRLTAIGVGTSHVQAVLFRGSSIEKSAGLIWCPPMGPGGGCRPIAAIEVRP